MEPLNKSGFIFGENGYEYPVIQEKNYYCVPSCLKMVLSSMGFHYSIEELASNFTIVTVDETTIDSELGIHIKNGDLNRLFNKINVPLWEEYIPINQISEFVFSDLIHNLLLQKAHIVCGYSYGLLFRDSSLLDIGHVSIILSSNSENVHILNPGPKFAGVNKVNEYDLYCAIRRKNDGLWVLKEKNEHQV